MAKRNFLMWRRPEYRDVAQRFQAVSYPPLIGWISDPSHPNPDIQDRMIAIDTYPEETERMLGEWDRGGSASSGLSPASAEEYHSNPMILGTRSFRTWWSGKGSLAGRSKGLQCKRCGGKLAPSQSHEIPDFDNPDNPSGIAYVHNSDSYGGCVNFDTEGRPWGARRTDR